MTLNARDDQAEKTKTTSSQTKTSPSTSDQSEVTEKAKEKARKRKKRREYQRKRDRREGRDGSPVAMGVNATQVTEDQKRSDAMARALRAISLRSPAITAIKKATTPGIALS